MARLGDFLEKQSRFLLANDSYALLYIALLAVIPFAAWLSAAIVALLTLRKGWGDGFKGSMVGILSMLLISSLSMPLLSAAIVSIVAFFPCYLAAGVLRTTASWRMTGGFVVLLTLIALVLLQGLAPDFIASQYRYVEMALKEVENEALDSSVASLLDNKLALTNYLVGIQALSVVLSAVISLMMARAMQARIFYPGGFRQEMICFRASALGVVLLLLAIFAAYQGNPLAISCLPVLIAYYVWAGISLSFNAFAKDKGIGVLILLVVPLIILPFVMLPVYVVFGALDSLFNFRLHLLSKTGGRQNKG